MLATTKSDMLEATDAEAIKTVLKTSIERLFDNFTYSYIDSNVEPHTTYLYAIIPILSGGGTGFVSEISEGWIYH